MKGWGRKAGWLGKCVFGTTLGLGQLGNPLLAQQLPPEQPVPLAIVAQAPAAQPDLPPADPSLPPTVIPTGEAPAGDPLAPAWVSADPINRVPNFMGDFFARGLRGCQPVDRLLTFNGGGEGNVDGDNAAIGFFFPLDVNGPGGPYQIFSNIEGVDLGNAPIFAAVENVELTGLVRANFPGARFIGGTLDLTGVFQNTEPREFILNYLLRQNVCVSLPNPAGGGLVGRNKYFDNGTPMPHDRVYFFYNHVGGFQGLGTGFDVNRYVFGFERTYFDNRVSVEVRLPFAGTANSDQVLGRELAVDDAEFGNLGVLVRTVVYRTPNFVAIVGLGFSAPTADDSQLLVAEIPVIAIENRTWLLQPIFGMAWAPNDSFYAQFGMQFDFDPSGNPVEVLTPGGLSRIGVLHDQGYYYLSGAIGSWVYQNNAGTLSAVALQGELHLNQSLGGSDSVTDGTTTVTDLGGDISAFYGTTGAIFQFGERTRLAVGVSFPLGGDQLYDWNLIAQLNYQFGAPR